MRTSELLGLVAALALVPARTTAQSARGLTLNWVRLDGAEHCISAAELMQRVETSVGRILFVRSGEAALSIDGYVQAVAKPRGWAVKLAVSTAQGEVLGARDLGVLAGDDCKIIEETIEFLLQVTLDADGTLDVGIPLSAATRKAIDDAIGGVSSDPDPEELPSASAYSATPQPVAPVTRRPSPPPPAAAPAGDPRSLRLGLAAAAETGQLPGAGFGVAVHVAQLFENGWAVAVSLGMWPSRDAVMRQGRVSIDLLGASFSACPLRIGTLLRVCGGAAYGRMTATPHGFKFTELTTTRASVALTASSLLDVELWGPLLLHAELRVLLPLLRNDYVFTVFDEGERQRRLFGAAPVAGEIVVGLSVRL